MGIKDVNVVENVVLCQTDNSFLEYLHRPRMANNLPARKTTPFGRWAGWIRDKKAGGYACTNLGSSLDTKARTFITFMVGDA